MSAGKSRRRGEELAPALFPFLAVMVCTIGALVFILTIAVSQASQAAKAEVAEAQDAIQSRQDYVVVATKELLAQRTDMQEQIDRSGATLTHYDQHIDELQQALQSLEIERTKINEQSLQKDKDQSQRNQQLEQLRQQADTLEDEIQDAMKDRKTKQTAYSIIPYVGPNGTARRPIYLECVANGVIIQPEGKLLTMDDLRPPHGPGNPLDAALRTIRSRLQRFENSSYIATPYPLLLVRPDGISSYAMARSAMSAWDDQHGYELIDAEMPLSFPDSLPGMASELESVIANARRRQIELIAAMPRTFNKAESWEDTPGDLAVARGDDPGYGESQMLGSPRTLGSGERFIESPSDSQWRSTPPAAVQQAMQADKANAQNAASQGNTSSLTSNIQTLNPNSQYELGGSRSLSGVNPQSSTGDQASLNQSDGQGGSSSKATNSANASANDSSSGTQQSGNATNDIDPQNRELVQELSKQRDPNASGNGNSSDSTQSNRPPSSSTSKSNSKSSQSISENLGSNWAIQRRQLSSTPVQRSIQIQVLQDRWLVMESGNSRKVERSIMLKDGPAICAKQLSQSVKNRIQEWGIAVAGGYWVPAINIQQSQDAQWSMDQLLGMLQDSGVEIQVAK